MGQYQKANPVRDINLRRIWAADRRWCYACGAGLALQTHHLVKPGRSDEATNLARLCLWCHGSAEGQVIVRFGERQPKLTFAHCLWLKRAHDPREYDPERLAVLFGQALPELEEPAEYYLHFLRKRKVLLA